MKLVNFEEFCRTPAGTIFAPYTPCVLEEGLAIKVDDGATIKSETYPYYTHCFNGVMSLQPWFGDDCQLWSVGDREDASFEVYDGSHVDYMDYDKFLIFEKDDVDRMINVLLWAKNGCIGEVKT